VTTIRRRLAVLIAFGLAAGSSACGGDGLVLPNESRAASITIVSGDAQSAAAGAALGQPLVVRVADALDRPVEGQAVAFTIDAGGGTVAPGSATTDADGRASASWTLGAAAGTQRVQARVEGDGLPAALQVGFTASASSGAGAIIELVSGDNQTGPVRSALADSLVVRVTDALHNPVAGVEVQWTVDGGGSISPSSVVTGADGLAAAERVLGNTAGTQTAQASAAGLTSVSFTHTAVAANPTILRLVSGDGQTGSIGNPLAEPLVVRLEDDNGNGVGGKSVTFVVGPSAGSAGPVNATTDPNGFASTVWTLGSSLGAKTMTAVFTPLTVAFTANAVAATPTKLVFTRPPQITAAGASFSPSIQVTVQDEAGNTVTAASDAITLALNPNAAGGVLSGTVTVNAVNGVASFSSVSIDKPGSGYTLTASATGLAGDTSPAFDIVPVQVATVLTITSDEPPTSIIGQPVTVGWNLTSSGTAPITGNVTVTVNGTGDTCSAPATLGSGTCIVNITLNGSRRLTAAFPGDANYASSSDNEAHSVTGTTSTTLTSSPNPSTVGQSVTFTAHVAPSGGSTGSPGGQVQFLDGTTLLGTRSLDGGDASIDVSSLAEGPHAEITAAYQGSSAFEPSTSDPITQQVDPVPNAAPTADADAYGVDEDTPLVVNVANGVLDNDTDPNGDQLTAVLDTPPSPGASLTLNSDGSFSYTPAADFNGNDRFTYHASDGSLSSAPATVTITVDPVNDAPSFTKGADVSLTAPTPNVEQTVSPWASDISAGPADESGQTLSFTASLGNPLADALLFTPDGQPSIDENGALTFTPSGVTGSTTVTVTLKDSGGGADTSAPQTFTITFNP
jgi:hypothetical protein